MKRKLFFAATAATLLFTGCANDEYVGEVENPRGELTEITFASKNAGITRAESSGSDAAAKLNNQFFVYGTKKVGNNPDQVVFKNYMVNYQNGTTSATNLKGWEYNGIKKNSYPTNGVTPNIFTGEGGSESYTQTPKYWDYSASSYTYYAFSAYPEDLKTDGSSTPHIKVVKKESPTDGNEYEVTLNSINNIQHLYFADKKTISKPNTTQSNLPSTNDNEYTGNVLLTFRPLTAKVRVGFYETIPGYSVEITKMYKSGGSGETTNFVAECKNIQPADGQTILINYDHTSNRANVSQVMNGESEVDASSDLTLGTNVFSNSLGTTSKEVTWDKLDKTYTLVWPQTTNTSPLKITVDYTLTSTDGSGETINVNGATAEVPSDYVKWMSGVAYTYLFKITDHTNGTTGGTTDPAGLYPIVFDAVVAEEDMGSVTTVSALSITASQDGTTDGFVSTEGIIFKTGTAISLKVMKGSQNVTSDTKLKMKSAFVTEIDANKTLDSYLTSATETYVSDLSIQNNNGYWVLKFTYTDSDTPANTSTSYLVLKVGEADDK